MSFWLKKFLINECDIPENKVHSVGGGSNIDFSLIETSKKNGNKFLFVGIDWERKNGNNVVKAFNLLNNEFPNLKLYIAGPKIKPKIITNPNVIFLNNLDSNELAYYYNLCDFFVMPSRFEAYGLVFGEALAFGLPCIGANKYSMPEFIKNKYNGRLISNVDSVYELYEAMEDIVVHQEIYKANVLKSRNFYINQFSWESVSDRILKFIKMDGYKL